MGWSKDYPNITDCSSPRRVVSSLISGLRPCRAKRVKADKELGNLTVHTKSLTRDLNETNAGQSCGYDNSVNLGVGCCLLYLITASKNELNTMINTRMLVEALLQSTRHELLKKEAPLCKVDKSNDTFACSATNGGEVHDFENIAKSSSVTFCAESSKWQTPKNKERIDQLETELEADLEHLQFLLDGRKMPKHSGQRRIKVTDEHTAFSRNETISPEEVMDPQLNNEETDRGLSPTELERRLHELLEARQQEQIRELEAALECVKHELYEMEMEAFWWEDTARIISQHAL